MASLGVDWAGKGWLACRLDAQSPLRFYPSVQSLWFHEGDVERVFIDIPMGLSSSGVRECDRLAADYLSKHNRRSSVFVVPTRSAVYARNLNRAREHQPDAGRGISNQAWSIVPRIREVDAFLRGTGEPLDVFRETHPEICFAKLAESSNYSMQPLAPKSEDEGIRQRMELLGDQLGRERFAELEESFLELTRPAYAPLVSENSCCDDFLDAAVCAVTAALDSGDRGSMPESPERDEKRIPMAIHHPEL